MQSPLLDFSTKLVKKVEDTVIILPTLSAMRCFKKALDPKHTLKQSQIIADATPLYNIDGFSILSPCLGQGAVYASLPPLLNKGANRVLLCGFAGALPNSNLEIADIVSAKGFYSLEGIKNNQLKEFHSSLSNNIADSKEAIIFTIDTPYDETSDSVIKYSKNASVIEMEAFATHSVCQKFNTEFSAHFVISDVWGKNWDNGAGSKAPFEALEKLFYNIMNSEVFPHRLQ